MVEKQETPRLLRACLNVAMVTVPVGVCAGGEKESTGFASLLSLSELKYRPFSSTSLGKLPLQISRIQVVRTMAHSWMAISYILSILNSWHPLLRVFARDRKRSSSNCLLT